MSNILVVGLGNPGREFEGTRHNVGAVAVATFAGRHGASFSAQRIARARVASVRMGVHRAVAAVPTTFMNDSGVAVAALVRHYLADASDPMARLVVVHDELDLAPGTVRLKLGGGTAGHNGLRSIGDHLHGLGFGRIRIGVGKPTTAAAGARHVLAKIGRADADLFGGACDRAADAIELVVTDGFARAMNVMNTR